MKNSITVIAIFIVGCVAGACYDIESDIHNLSLCILYALMLQVGIGIGSNKSLRESLRHVSPKILLVPLATITGTLLFSAVASLLLSQWSVFDCMAVGSGFAYYSLSSILITQFKEPSIGLHRAWNDSPAQQHHTRDDGSCGCSSHTPLLWKAGSHIGCGRQLDGCTAAFHHPLFG